MSSYIEKQQELRAAAWEQAKALLDTAAAESRDLTGEEQQSYDRINAELDQRAQVIERLRADHDREARAAEFRIPEVTSQRSPEPKRSDNDILRSLARGEMRSATFEARDLNTTDDGAVVPQGFYAVLQEQLIYAGPMLEPGIATIITTGEGNDIKVPRQTAFSQATATAEAAQFGESEPTFNSFTLRAHKFGTLLQVSRELLEDTGIDLVGFLGRQFGHALGTAVNAKLTLGTGTVEPNGIVPASSLGETGGTGVVGAFTADDLIDLAHSVDSAVARQPGVGFMMNRASLGAVRKLKDDDGRYLFEPSMGGVGDSLLGFRIIENPDVVSQALNAKSVLFGDFSSYHIRRVGPGVDIARSDDFAFDSDLVTFRASIRLDGDLGQSANVKHFVGGTA
jgi:HK97 family phage major capsid protein